MDEIKVKAYGGIENDGKIQVSFTLPYKLTDSTREAALEIATNMNLKNPLVVHAKQLSNDFTFFVVYGELDKQVSISTSDTVSHKKFSPDELKYVLKNLDKPLVVVGATTGTDAHTVGLDAILNMKGIQGHKGLESYPNIICYNMGSQVPNEVLIQKAIEVKADFILVSQTVTQNDCHIINLKQLRQLLDNEYKDYHFTVYIGGARITNKLVLELGFDKGFGAGSLPEDTVEQMLLDKNLIIMEDEKHEFEGVAESGRHFEHSRGYRVAMENGEVPRVSA